MKIEYNKDTVQITIDTKKEGFRPSKSGKTQVISTGGFVSVPNTEGWKIGLNLTKPI